MSSDVSQASSRNKSKHPAYPEAISPQQNHNHQQLQAQLGHMVTSLLQGQSDNLDEKCLRTATLRHVEASSSAHQALSLAQNSTPSPAAAPLLPPQPASSSAAAQPLSQTSQISLNYKEFQRNGYDDDHESGDDNLSNDNDDEDDDADNENDDDDDDDDEEGGSSFDAHRKKKTRTVFSRHQVFQLESTFDMKRYLSSSERSSLAASLQLTETQIKIWFQNRRNKWKRQLAAEIESSSQVGLLTNGSGSQIASANNSLVTQSMLSLQRPPQHPHHQPPSQPQQQQRARMPVGASFHPHLQTNGGETKSEHSQHHQQQLHHHHHHFRHQNNQHHNNHHHQQQPHHHHHHQHQSLSNNSFAVADHLESSSVGSGSSSSSASSSSSHSSSTSPSAAVAAPKTGFNAAAAALLSNMAVAGGGTGNSGATGGSLLSPSMLAAASSLYYAATTGSQFPGLMPKQPLSSVL